MQPKTNRLQTYGLRFHVYIRFLPNFNAWRHSFFVKITSNPIFFPIFVTYFQLKFRTRKGKDDTLLTAYKRSTVCGTEISVFAKNGYTFNGSKIDRQFSYSKIDFLLKQNEKARSFQANREHNRSQNQSLTSALGGLLDLPTPEVFDYEEAEFQRRTKKKKKGIRI